LRYGHFLISAVRVGGVVSLLAAPLSAQRIGFPTPDPYSVPSNPYVVPSTTPPAVIGPYPTTPFGASPAVGPPPPFDPYAVGGSVAPAPPPVPYYPPPAPVMPPGAPLVPPPAPPLTPGASPLPYQPPPYDIQTSGEGYWAKTQKLIQELSFEFTYLYGKHSDPFDLEITRAEISSTFAFPMFYSIETPLLVTPGFAFNWLEGPATPAADLPPQLYDAYLDFAWFPRCYEWLGGELGFRTGVWSDFDHVNSDSVRLLGRALASVAVSPNTEILFGAVYLDRVDVKLLPAGGVYYRPTPEWDLYLVFPNPKARKFLTAIGNTKWYGYAAGEYGGGSWTVQRAVADRIDINDIRVIGGLEWETQTLIRGHIEVGYVFDREIVYTSGMPPSFTPDDTVMIRAGVDF
jgi:hypothetical protein